jgi:hypothetical protein
MSTINNIGLASDLTPSSKKVDSLTILRGLEIQGNLINNAVETAKDNESCLVTRTTNLAIDNLGPNPVVFNTEVFDGHNNFSGSVYTVRFNGVYSVSCHVEFAANAAGTRRLDLTATGANWSYRQESSCRACDSGTTSLTVTIGPCIMERGTLIEANASQTAAASLNIIGGSLFVTLIRLSDTLL